MPTEQNPRRYRVRAALTALKYMQNGHSTFVTVPRGSVIAIKSKRREFEVVEIDWEGTALVVFNRDIDERTVEVLVSTSILGQVPHKGRGGKLEG